MAGRDLSRVWDCFPALWLHAFLFLADGTLKLLVTVVKTWWSFSHRKLFYVLMKKKKENI
jgi:hypothetical protein